MSYCPRYQDWNNSTLKNESSDSPWTVGPFSQGVPFILNVLDATRIIGHTQGAYTKDDFCFLERSELTRLGLQEVPLPPGIYPSVCPGTGLPRSYTEICVENLQIPKTNLFVYVIEGGSESTGHLLLGTRFQAKLAQARQSLASDDASLRSSHLPHRQGASQLSSDGSRLFMGGRDVLGSSLALGPTNSAQSPSELLARVDISKPELCNAGPGPELLQLRSQQEATRSCLAFTKHT